MKGRLQIRFLGRVISEMEVEIDKHQVRPVEKPDTKPEPEKHPNVGSVTSSSISAGSPNLWMGFTNSEDR